MRRVVVTGSSGSMGRAIVREIRRRFPRAEILGVDVSSAGADSLDRFVQSDIRRSEVADEIVAFAPDAVLHFAFVVDPIYDEQLMRSVNIGGTNTVFNAVRRAKPAKFLTASSATAYGAWPDNPVPMSEDAPLRAVWQFRYAADKTAIERQLARFAAENPDVVVSWTRATVVMEPGSRNYLARLLETTPVYVKPDGFDTPFQFVHMDDVVAATMAILESDARGPFNVSPSDFVRVSEIAKMRNRKVIPVPCSLCKTITALCWGLRWWRVTFPAGFWFYLRHPWVIESARLQKELGFEFQHTSRETIEMMVAEWKDSSQGVTGPSESLISRARLAGV